MLCYLELSEKRLIKNLGRSYCKCKVISYSGELAMRTAAKDCPPLNVAIAMAEENSKSTKPLTTLEFDVIEVALALGWKSGSVKYALKQLEWNKQRKSKICVQFSDLGFFVRSPGDLSDKELDESLDLLYNRMITQQKTELQQLKTIFEKLKSISFHSIDSVIDSNESLKMSDKLKVFIRQYFEKESEEDYDENFCENVTSFDRITNDIHGLIQLYPDNIFTGRSIARIFHGISSPNYPAVIWSRCKYWRLHLKSDFNKILEIANNEIIRQKIQ